MNGNPDRPITYQPDGDIAVIALNRPDKRNADSARVVEARAAVIHGTGKHDCAGLGLAAHVEMPLVAAAQGSRRCHWIFGRFERGAIPLVCAMQGAFVDGRSEPAAAAPIRVADRTVFFGLPEGRRGIPVGGGGPVRIDRLIGVQ